MLETSTMKYPFGRCAKCGKEFNSELLGEYEITHCPWCGEKILDYFHDEDTDKYIYCEECGTRIYERVGKGGKWIEEGKDKYPGVCAGPCERELCGQCADWDVNGECEQCRTSPCGQCPSHDAVETCQKCEHLPERKKWADYIPPEVE